MKMHLMYMWMTIFTFMFQGVSSKMRLGESMQLEYTVRPGNCLQAASGDNLPSIDSCNASAANQQWKLDEYGKLQNYVTNHGFHCAYLESLNIKNCTEFSGQWTCLPFALKIDENHYLAVRDHSIGTSQDFVVYREESGRNNVIWRKYRDTSGNTCNNSDFKLHMGLNPKTWKGHHSTSRNIVGIHGTLLPVDATANLGDFRGSCISDPDTCLNGLSFELWLWFADYGSRKSSSGKSVILQTGSESSRGFELSVTNATIAFTVYSEQYISESFLQIQSFKRWVHLLGVWVKSTKMAQLFADGVNVGCVVMQTRGETLGDTRGNLLLGPASGIGLGRGFVVLRNLTIWMRTVDGTERRRILEQSVPEIPDAWTSWSKCTKKCEQKRNRTSNGLKFDVTIVETRECYDIRECGLRIMFPLDEASFLRCYRCRQLNASSALILPMNSSSIHLDDFRGTCLSDPKRCVNGMTFEIWVWFAEYNSSWPHGDILKAGRFRLSVTSDGVIFTVFPRDGANKCRPTTYGVDQWLHIIGKWDKGSNNLSLYVNNLSKISVPCEWLLSHSSGGDSDDRKLSLGPVSRVDGGYVVAKNLSIWMRALNESELESLMSSSSPGIPGQWVHWDTCEECKKTRYRRCSGCGLEIAENITCCGPSNEKSGQKASLIVPIPTVNEKSRQKTSSIVPTPTATSPQPTQKASSIAPTPTGPSTCRRMLEANSLDFYSIKEFCQDWFWKGWLVILNRTSGKLNFARDWEGYKDGFGEPNDEHWIGNEKLYKLTHKRNYKLMVYFDHNPTMPTLCEFFGVAAEKDNFALKLSLCRGPAAHALGYSDGAMFSTYGQDNDQGDEENCAKQYGGGFWYRHCSKVNFTTPRKGNKFVVSYLTENGTLIKKHAVKMMMKPNDKHHREVITKIRFIEEEWNNDLGDVATHAFFLLAGKIKRNLEEVYRNDGTYVTAAINSFRPGSVIANITLAYSEFNATQIILLLQDLDSKRLNGQMPVSYDYSNFRILGSSASNEAPQIKKVYNTSTTSFNVSWYHVNNMTAVRGYKVYYNTRETQNWMVHEVSKDFSTAEIDGLKAFTLYHVYVLAYSDEGNDLPSRMHNVNTSEGVPEVGPANLTAYWNKTDYSVRLTWSQIPQPLVHGHLTHYVITYSNKTHIVTGTSRTKSFIMTGLALFTKYTITVAGATSMGTGNRSTIVYRTRGLPLPPPMNLIATNTTGSVINVSWTPIPDERIFDQVTGYRIYFYDKGRVKRINIPANQTKVTIPNVAVNQHYEFTVMGLTFGNREGRRATTSSFIQHITAPPKAPSNLNCPGISPYTISVGWHEFKVQETGGSLTGYVLRYKVKGDPGNKTEIKLGPHPPWYTLENLPIFTEYEIEVLVENVKGRSSWASITCKTNEGGRLGYFSSFEVTLNTKVPAKVPAGSKHPAPTVIPQALQAQSYVGETFITLSWEHFPTNGTRSGYKLLYRKVADADIKLNNAKLESLEFSANATTAQVDGLDRYSKYCFQLSVFNEYFQGKPSSSVCAETCRCPHIFYTNWFLFDPYIVTPQSGIFPPLVQSMVRGVCGLCKAYNNTALVNFTMDGRGRMARKNSSKLVQLVKTEDVTQFSYPVIGPITGSASPSGSFIPVIDNPESVFISRKPVISTVAQTAIGTTIIDTLPFFAFMFIIVFLGGILIWAVEFKNQDDTFPKPFHKGVQQGFWWAFVSVTTVGYGDKVPSTIAGRVLSIIWVLYGTVLVGLITVSLTMALTTVMVVISTKDVTIYGSRVAAIENSIEIQLGLHKGARMNEGRNFSDVNSILKAVENGDTDGALIDKLTAARIDELRKLDSALEVKEIFPKPTTYGIYLSGDASKLHKKFRQYLRNNADFVINHIKSYSQPLKVNIPKEEDSIEEENEVEAESTSESSIISASSPIFLPLLLWLIGVLIFLYMIGLAWHFLYYKHVAKVAKNKVCASHDSKTEISSLRELAKEFREETYQKLRNMKYRHFQELRVLHKFKTC